MNLIFRLIWMFVTATFGSRRDPMAESRMTFRCWPTDIDINRHMTNSRYHSFTDLVRIDLVIRSGAWKRLRAAGALPVLASAVMRFRKSIMPFQKVIVTAKVLSWDDRWIYIEHRFIVNNNVVAISIVKTTFLNKQGRIPMDQLIALMGYDGPKPDLAPVIERLNDLDASLKA